MLNILKSRNAYGFNRPEEAFCWTTHEFGLRVEAGRALDLAFQSYARENHLLHCYSTSMGSKAYRLQDGSQSIRIRNESAHDQVFHFRIEPKISYPTDVRDLGILVTSLEAKAPEDGSQKLPPAPEFLVAEPSDFRPNEEIDVGSVLAENLMRRYIERGWLRTHILEVTDSRFALEFAIYPPHRAGLNRTSVSFLVNDEVIKVPVLRPADPSGFVLRDLPDACYRGVLDCSAPYRSNKNRLDIELMWDEDGSLFPGQTQHWRGPGSGPLPEQANIARVAGHISQDSFAFTGATWFVKLERMAQSLLGPDFGGGQVLDWGCGCGRILRYFPIEMATRVDGVDIDAINIEWCNRHYRGAFHLVQSDPPMPFADGAFTLVYGHSVLTHLGEDDQFRWLAELARVLCTGGYLLVTVLAELSWFARFYPNRRTPEGFASYLSRGFFDDGWLDVGVDAGSIGRYRSVSHTEDYIRNHWSRYFEIVEFVPGFADLQTLVVLRKR